MTDLQIPNKSQFKVDEVCSLTGIKPYVLRFWESEFEEISPEVSDDGKKLYDHKDIECIALVKKLLFDDKLTIEKARQELRLILLSRPVPAEADPIPVSNDRMEKLLMARNKLNRLIELADALKQRHNWDQ